MTTHDDPRSFGTDTRDVSRADVGDAVETAPGTPIDRVRWGPILAGTFAALTMLAILNTLGTAIGLSAWDPGDSSRRFAIGAGIWGLLSLLLSFGFGGWIAGRSEALRGHDNGLLNGFMVAAVGIPLLLFMLGSAMTSAAGTAAEMSRDNGGPVARSQSGGASAPAAVGGDNLAGAGNAVSAMGSQRDTTRSDTAQRLARNTAWSTFAALILSLVAASFAGGLGAQSLRNGSYDADDHRRQRGPARGM